MIGQEHWVGRFASPLRIAVRPSRGGADVAHVIEVGESGPQLSVWQPGEAPRPTRQLDGDLLQSLATPDGLGVLRMRDGGGDEMGHVWLADLAGDGDIDLTPKFGSYTLRGIDTVVDGLTVALTIADESGFSQWVVEPGSAPRGLFHSINESWNGRISADGAMVSVDTTEHSPGVRRFGVTAIDVASGATIATLFDKPAGTARAVRWSPVPGDERVLVVSERSGFARPTIWSPRTGERVEFPLDDLVGEVMPVDWSPDAARVLAVHIDEGEHRLLELDVATGGRNWLDHPDGAVFHPDIAAAHTLVTASYYAPSGAVRIVRERSDVPMAVWESRRGSVPELVLPPLNRPFGTAFESRLVRADDGTSSQLWLGRPKDATVPVPTILHIHGGPTYVSSNQFDPVAQAWIDEGFAYASLNYRGSVLFGRDFREAFIGRVGVSQLADVEAAVRALVEEGVADPDALFITGASFGGYMTLYSMARLPELFRGGFAFVPMADFAEGYEDSNPAMKAAFNWFFGGSPDVVSDALREAAVATHIDGIRAPLWIKAGTADTRTPIRQVNTFVEQMRARGGDVAVDVFGGGHSEASAESAVADQHTMIELARRAMRGAQWSTPEER